MNSAVLLLASTMVLTAQALVPAPHRVGPTAEHLTSDDLAQIARIVGDAQQATSWVIVARAVPLAPPPVPWLVDVYFPPDATTERVRRGGGMTVRAELPSMEDFSAARTWRPLGPFEWAQVPELGRDPDQVMSGRDFNRPFRVTGIVTDESLTCALDAIRTSPPLPVPPGVKPGQMASELALRVQGMQPVASVHGPGDGSVDVRLRTNLQESGGQVVRAVPRADGWEIELVSVFTHGE